MTVFVAVNIFNSSPFNIRKFRNIVLLSFILLYIYQSKNPFYIPIFVNIQELNTYQAQLGEFPHMCLFSRKHNNTIFNHIEGKTNLSHDGLNPAHVPYQRVNNPTLSEFCFRMIERADIKGSKSYVAMILNQRDTALLECYYFKIFWKL